MKKLALFLAFLLTATFSLKAQETGVVRGKSIDANQASLPFVNILLLHPADSSLVKGTVSDESGSYILEDIPFGQYRIMASAVGMKKEYGELFTINTENPEHTEQDILLLEDTETLQEAVVIAQKPFIERQIDKTVVNVENSIIAAGNDALEVLKRSPGVMVDKDGNISMKGKQGVTILIDGRPTYLSQQDLSNMLKNMPADQVEKIELITNPSARFDAAGNAGVINIVLKKNKNTGWNGSAFAGFRQAFYPKYNAGTNLNYRFEKANVFLNYNINRRKGAGFFDLTRNFRENELLTSAFDQSSFTVDSNRTHTLKFGTDFFLNDKHTLGFFINGMSNKGTDRGNNITSITDASDAPLSSSQTLSNNTSKWENISTNINYLFKIDTTGKELSLNLDYAIFDNSTKQYYATQYIDAWNNTTGPIEILTSSLPSRVNIASGKLDYVHPFSQKVKLESGWKSSYVTTDNNAQFFNEINSIVTVDTTKTNHFQYTENINAGYLTLSAELSKKWSIQLGLRGEHTHAIGNQITTDSTFTRDYFQLFPSGFLNYKINDKNELNFSYSRRIDRPNYQDLNPFLYFLDPYTYMQGNTLLQPQFSNSFELTHTFMGFLNTSIGYTKTTDVITQVTRQVDSTRTTYATNENLNTQENINFSTSFPIPMGKKLSSFVFFNGYYNRYQGELDGGTFDEGLLSWMVHMQTMLKLNKGWIAEMSFFYMSEQVYGIFIMKPMSNLNFGIEKKFLKDKASLKLSYSDVLWMSRFRGSVRYQNMDINMEAFNDSRMLGVNFTYRFGKGKPVNPRKESGAKDELERVGGGGGGGNPMK